MNFRFGIVLALALLSAVCATQVHAQTPLSPEARRAFRQRQLQEAIEEKLHIDSGSSVEKSWEKNGPTPATIQGGSHSPASYAETVVTSTPSEGEVHAAINPIDTNNLVVADMYLTESSVLAFPIYYTKDFGQTWKRSSFQPAPYESDARVVGGGDPVLTFDANGTVYLAWIDLYSSHHTRFEGMYWAFSTDGGENWQHTANGFIGRDSEVIEPSLEALDDKEWLAVDRSNSPYRNTFYAAWTRIDLDTNGYGILVRRKLPSADSMEAPVQILTPNVTATEYTSIAIDARGGVHVTYLGTTDTSIFSLYHVYSGDGGATFTPAVKISDIDLPKRSPDAMQTSVYGIRTNGNYPCPQLSIDTAVTGNLYMVWDGLGTTQNELHGTDIYFSRSTDNGESWSTPSIINNDSPTRITDQFYPSIAVNSSGIITATWYDRREDSSNKIGRYYIGQSTDQGMTWTNYPVASRPMDFRVVGDSNGGFGIGEYTQVLMTPNYTIPVWADGRTNDGNLYAYAAFFSMNSTGIQDPPSGVLHPDRETSVGDKIQLLDNYPNPFSSKTTLAFKLDSRAHVQLYITNMLGQVIESLYNGMANAGEHDFSLDASNLVSGTYYCNLETDLGIARKAITVTH